MKVDGLKQQLENRSLSKSGVKVELQKRLAKSLGLHLPSTTITQPQTEPEDSITIAEYEDFKKYVTHEIFTLKEHISRQQQQQGQNADINNNIINHQEVKLNELHMEIICLKSENEHLKKEAKSKQTIIEILQDNINIINKEDTQQPQQQSNNNDWYLPKRIARKRNQTGQTEDPIKLHNRFSNFNFNDNNNSIQVEQETIPRSGNKPSSQDRILHNKGGSSYFNKHPERDIPFQRKLSTSNTTIPGNSQYSRIIDKGKKVMVFSDSHGSRIRKKEFSSWVMNGTANIKAFPGAKAQHLEHYIVPSLMDEKPDTVVIMVGANNIRTTDTDEFIATTIINTGKKCRQEGVNDIYISSLTCRVNMNENQRVNAVNFILKSLCIAENFIFINNDNITPIYLHADGIHLVPNGTAYLANNILNGINSIYYKPNSSY